jgi:hypothetical protein
MRRKAAALCLFAALLLHGCAASPQPGNLQTPPATTTNEPATAPPTASGVSAEHVEDYFPAVSNARYVYEGVGSEYASYVENTEFLSGNRMQLRVDNGGSIVSRVFKWEDGKLIRVNSKEVDFVREDLLSAPETESEVLLMEPLTVGTTWDAAGGKRSITGADVQVDTPTGSINALEVTTQTADSTTLDYYEKGTGLVKSVFRSGDTEISSSLAELKTDSPYLQVVRLYYPGADGSGLYYKDVQLTLPTNASLASALQVAYKTAPGNIATAVFTPGTSILNLARSTQNTVAIDLSQAFIAERSPVGAAYEKGALQSLAQTLGDLFMADDVLITVEGKPYQSSAVSMKEDETFPVSNEDAQAIVD